MKYAFLRDELSGSCTTRMACRLLEVSPSGYYHFLKAQLAPRKQRRLAIEQAVVRVHAESRRIYGANPSMFYGARNPVELVSWNACQSFCRSSGLRLASESEWEYACRAGTTTAYSFGAGITKQQANFSSGGTVACGSLPANQWGFREMHGNVYEWCEDGYETMGSGKQDAVKSETTYRVLRGGSWFNYTNFGRSSYRFNGAAGSTSSNIGFRVARFPL